MIPMKSIAIAAVSLSLAGAGAAYAFTPAAAPEALKDGTAIVVPVDYDGERGSDDRGKRGWHRDHRGEEGRRGVHHERRGPGGPGGWRHGRGGPHEMGMMMVMRLADTNDDGALSQDEVDAFIAAQLDEANVDGADGMTLTEFQTIWLDITRPMMVRAFQFMDTDGDAVISQEEIDDRFANVVEKFDRNGDGQLDRGDRHGGKPPRGDRGPGPRGDDDGDDE